MSKSKHFSRRQFLAAGAAAVAVPYFVPAKAFGANDRINVAYIGTGRRAKDLRAIPDDMQAVALADVNMKRLQDWRESSWGKKQGIQENRLYQDYREMLELDEVDAVIISTPDHWHALNSIHAMKAGKDVYVEKPMTLTIREGRLMVDTARKLGRICQVGTQQRSSRENRIACALVRDGRIGNVHTVHAANYPSPWECDLPEEKTPEHIDWDMWNGPVERRGYNEKLYLPRVGQGGHEWGWISFRPYSGGEMTGWGAHGFDQIQWALGKDNTSPVKIWPVPDSEPDFDGIHRGPRCHVHMEYADGTLLKVDGQGAGAGGWFEGDKGEIKIDRTSYASNIKDIGKDLPELPVIQQEGGTAAHIVNWAHAVRTHELPNSDVEICHHSTILCHLGNIARWLGREAKWDSNTETFPGDDEANKYLDRERQAPWTL